MPSQTHEALIEMFRDQPLLAAELLRGPLHVAVPDLDLARRLPELAVLSALAHGSRPDPTPVFEALFTALGAIDHDHANMYTDLILKELPEAARKSLEEFMPVKGYQYQSDFARRYFSEGEAQGIAKGEAQGEARAVLEILDARGIDVPDAIRAKITACRDLDRLAVWIRQAATARKIEDLDL